MPDTLHVHPPASEARTAELLAEGFITPMHAVARYGVSETTVLRWIKVHGFPCRRGPVCLPAELVERTPGLRRRTRYLLHQPSLDTWVDRHRMASGWPLAAGG